MFGKDQKIAKWVAQRIPVMHGRGFGENVKAIGVVDGNGKELAGVVFHDYLPEFKTISFSIAASSRRWATRKTIALLLYYPFIDAEVTKLWTSTPHKNERALKLIQHVGFTREAVLSHHFGKEHAIISRMFLKDYRRLYGEDLYGFKANSARAA